MPEVAVGVQRSLEQRPPGAGKRRRSGASSGHLLVADSAPLADARLHQRLVQINGPDSLDSHVPHASLIVNLCGAHNQCLNPTTGSLTLA